MRLLGSITPSYCIISDDHSRQPCFFSLKCKSSCTALLFNWAIILICTCSGNGDLTYEEAKSHFTAWALMKSPLLIVSGHCCMHAIIADSRYIQSTDVSRTWCFSFSAHLCRQLSRISEETLAIFKNEEIIAINQDPVVGTSIVPFRWGVNVSWFTHTSISLSTLIAKPFRFSRIGRITRLIQHNIGLEKLRMAPCLCSYVMMLFAFVLS